MEAQDYFQVDEPPTDTPLFDRLRDDTAPLARLRYNLSTIRPLDDDAKERLARKYYNEQLVPDERRAAAQHAAILSQVARDDGAGSEAMAAQLGALNSTLREIDDTEFSLANCGTCTPCLRRGMTMQRERQCRQKRTIRSWSRTR